LTGDGVLAEGSYWEAALAGAMYGMDNLFVIVVKNMLDLAGLTAEIMPLGPVVGIWRAVGLTGCECDGRGVAELVRAVAQ
ncbi:transketolase, partial [Pseudomonas syringae pv. tagetis]